MAIIDWMKQFAATKHLQRETVSLAIKYLDQVGTAIEYEISSIPDSKDMEAYAVTCLYLAAKFEEIRPPPLYAFASCVTSNTLDELAACERKTLQVRNSPHLTPLKLLQWKLMIQTPEQWLQVIFKKLQDDEGMALREECPELNLLKLQVQAQALLELAYLTNDSTTLSPKTLSLCLVFTLLMQFRSDLTQQSKRLCYERLFREKSLDHLLDEESNLEFVTFLGKVLPNTRLETFRPVMQMLIRFAPAINCLTAMSLSSLFQWNPAELSAEDKRIAIAIQIYNQSSKRELYEIMQAHVLDFSNDPSE